MILENLFAHESQNRVFLALTACGMALTAFLQFTAFLRRKRGLGLVLDGLTGAMMLGMLLTVLWRFEGGIRAYGALGLIIGSLLYMAGLAQPIRWLMGKITKLFHQRRKSPHEKEGISHGDGELNSQEPRYATKE